MKALFRFARGRERGTTFVMLTVFIVALFAFAALSLDVGNVLREQRNAQSGTDAAALAAVLALTNTPQSVTEVQALAYGLANTNRVTTAEIGASTVGTVEVGAWTNRQFLAGATVNGRYSAVRVPARRVVPLYFGRVVGVTQMRPQVESVAMIDSLGAATGLRPFTISSNLLNGVGIGSQLTVVENQVGQLNSGQWGQLDYQNTLQGDAWYDAMVGGYQGLIPMGSTWAVLNQGNDHVRQAFEYLIRTGETILIPVIDTFDDVPNNGYVNIIGFVGLRVWNYRNRGRNSEITFELKQALGSGQGGGPNNPLYAQVRLLVK